MKVCTCCKQQKPLSKFGKNKSMKDGLQIYCKPCYRAIHAEWRANNLEHAREVDRKQKRKDNKRKGREQVNAEYQIWYNRNREHKCKYERDRHDPVKARANNLLNKAIERGDVTRPNICSRCGEERKVDGHHHDYSKPLDVTWICRGCHTKLTNEEKRKRIED